MKQWITHPHAQSNMQISCMPWSLITSTYDQLGCNDMMDIFIYKELVILLQNLSVTSNIIIVINAVLHYCKCEHNTYIGQYSQLFN